MRSVGRLAVSFLLACACNSAHTGTSTETGNPPVIDVDKISLVVGTDDARIVGAPGAVKPGGAEVELAILGTGEVARAKSKPDGSFSVTVDARPDSVFEVSASSGEMRSSAVYVTRGGATVGGGKGVTCMERSSLARQVLTDVLGQADTSCTTTDDCRAVDLQPVCREGCAGTVVATSALPAFEAAVELLADGICRDFAADGCEVPDLTCPAPPIPGVATCVDGQCSTMAFKCPSCLAKNIEWGTAMATNHSINDCDRYQDKTGGDTCERAVPHCDSSGGRATIEDVLVALDNPAVKQALAEETVFGLPNPGGLAPKITVDGASLVIFGCGTNPSCMIPDGITRLKDLLDRIANEAGCQ